ncbi:60S ribosomal protein L31 [Candidatus Pacearchaeota archaeon]|nr:60S ribosomal protein L31 [Candidatus Pacearchaeota archaeon]
MAKKTEIKTEKIEREYIIPLREKCRPVPRYKKTPKAVKTVKEFLVRHMKIRDRDLKKIKIDRYLNEALWFRGIKKPPIKIKVKVVKEGDIVRVELFDMPDKLKFKKLREEKREQKAGEIKEKKKSMMEKAKETMQKPKEEVAVEEEKKTEEKEKKSAVIEAGEKLEKAAAKTTKHMTKTAGKMTKQKHQVRKALAK